MNKKRFDVRNNLIYLLVLRWAALVHAAALFELGIDTGPIAVFVAAVIYVGLLTVFRLRVTELIKRYPLLLQVDLLMAAAMIWVSGGAWKSPYFAYAFTCIMVFPFFTSMRNSLLSTVMFCVYYTMGLFFSDAVIATVADKYDLDTLFSNYVAFILTVLFFGYPANIIKTIETTDAATLRLRDYIDETNTLLASARFSSLTKREAEIYSLLCEGKSNAEIAESLYISEKTVRNHLYNLYKKIDVGSRSEAIIKCHSEITSHAGDISTHNQPLQV